MDCPLTLAEAEINHFASLLHLEMKLQLVLSRFRQPPPTAASPEEGHSKSPSPAFRDSVSPSSPRGSPPPMHRDVLTPNPIFVQTSRPSHLPLDESPYELTSLSVIPELPQEPTDSEDCSIPHCEKELRESSSGDRTPPVQRSPEMKQWFTGQSGRLGLESPKERKKERVRNQLRDGQRMDEIGPLVVHDGVARSGEKVGLWRGETCITRCVCGVAEDDEWMIECETCFVWLHCVCLGFENSEDPPAPFQCPSCDPSYAETLPLSPAQARQMQLDRILHSKSISNPPRKPSKPRSKLKRLLTSASLPHRSRTKGRPKKS